MEPVNALKNVLQRSVETMNKNHPPRQGYMVPVLAGLVMYGGAATVAAATFLSLTA